jgi:2',3'-cyclic-nucleotide 2'-phosphodiesterase (5'-nucleotidase family)
MYGGLKSKFKFSKLLLDRTTNFAESCCMYSIVQTKVIHRVIHLFIILGFVSCQVKYTPQKPAITFQEIKQEKENKSYQKAEKLIEPYRTPIDSLMKEAVAFLDNEATKSRPEGALGNLIADITREIAANMSKKNIDACFLNNGGLRIELPKGTITRSMVFELLPFDNDLVIVKFKGNQLQDILNQIATKKGEPVSGIRMRINQNLAEEITINGKALQKDSTYYVVSSDYLLNNGDNFQIPTPIERIDLNIKLRDAVFKYFIELKKNQITLSPKLDGRIY